ncbi:MAG: hypothetical protein ACI9QD_000043 [Thermoproteota archaeon]|jgi:hypothetical protein
MLNQKILLTVLFILSCFTSSASSFAKERKYYASYKMSPVSWYLTETDGLDYIEETHTTLDFSMSFDNWSLSMIMDMGEDTEKTKSIAANIGFGKWNMVVEKGKISGEISAHERVDVNPVVSEFSNDYKLIGFYKTDQAFSGFGYLNFKMPLHSEVNYYDSGASESMTKSFIDPEAEVTVLGWYHQTDTLKKKMRYKSYAGFDASVYGLVGMCYVENSDIMKATLEVLAGDPIDMGGELSFGASSHFSWGFVMTKVTDEYDWGFEIGYEFKVQGTIMSLGDSDLNFGTDPGAFFAIPHGPYVRFAGQF